jgi:hypothetical protein
VRAYTTSGGAYAVARDNLGARPALVAASALLVDYVLTVAVSVSAGVTAITSAYPSLASLRLPMALSFIAVLTLVNLRGVRDTGLVLAAPMYAFVVAVLATIAVGLVRCAGECPHAAVRTRSRSARPRRTGGARADAPSPATPARVSAGAARSPSTRSAPPAPASWRSSCWRPSSPTARG